MASLMLLRECPDLGDLSHHRECVRNDIGTVTAVIPRLRRDQLLCYPKEDSESYGSLEIELVERVGVLLPFTANA